MTAYWEYANGLYRAWTADRDIPLPAGCRTSLRALLDYLRAAGYTPVQVIA